MCLTNSFKKPHRANICNESVCRKLTRCWKQLSAIYSNVLACSQRRRGRTRFFCLPFFQQRRSVCGRVHTLESREKKIRNSELYLLEHIHTWCNTFFRMALLDRGTTSSRALSALCQSDILRRKGKKKTILFHFIVQNIKKLRCFQINSFSRSLRKCIGFKFDVTVRFAFDVRAGACRTRMFELFTESFRNRK